MGHSKKKHHSTRIFPTDVDRRVQLVSTRRDFHGVLDADLRYHRYATIVADNPLDFSKETVKFDQVVDLRNYQ